MVRQFTAIDIFAGAGGLSEGLEQAGIEIAAANEYMRSAALTYKYNHRNTHLFVKDVKKLDIADVKKTVGKEIDLVCGGPPCAGFSMLGRRNPDDPRNKLFRQFVRIVKEVKPSCFLMENVEGLLTIENGKTVETVEKSFRALGYNVSRTLVNAAFFGVPQARKRVFIFGSFDSGIDINHMKQAKNKTVSVSDAISDLDFLEVGESSNEYVNPQTTRYQKTIRNRSKTLHNHSTSKHTETVVKRFASMKQGDTARDMPEEYRTKKNIRYRLSENAPAKTVTTMPDDYVHYRANRILSVREMARLQSFRDTYIFFGPRTSGGKRRANECPQYTQVGNAVPPILAKSVGKWILSNR